MRKDLQINHDTCENAQGRSICIHAALGRAGDARKLHIQGQGCYKDASGRLNSNSKGLKSNAMVTKGDLLRSSHTHPAGLGRLACGLGSSGLAENCRLCHQKQLLGSRMQ